ncbi:E3 ubiquitin-protein ligase TRIM39 [Liparis tanakae]|uniref:E3 ubiquitin-protein ligase TRIM39 n=1 Tax=Liparis tanakae TaxID=230148 RepID=A0A4Z2G6U7_9TELE|nr:E3 ubiquitin-protein ligase TRIM39 [Liparis tanakae]
MFGADQLWSGGCLSLSNGHAKRGHARRDHTSACSLTEHTETPSGSSGVWRCGRERFISEEGRSISEKAAQKLQPAGKKENSPHNEPRIILSEYQYEKPGKKDWKERLLCMLEAGGECDMGPHKRVIMDWTRGIKSRPQPTIWPGEPVVMMLEDLEFQWKRGRLPNLLPAVELVMLAVMNADSPAKEDVTKQWLVSKQRSQNVDAVRYIPHSVWNWICDAAEEVTLDSDSANGDLLISGADKRMRCGLERREVPRCRRRFDGWWCAAGREGYASGRHYWEVEVGERDWRLGVAKASAVRQGFRSLTTDTGYLTLRLERGVDLKALTVPAAQLPPGLAPRKVGVYLDYELGQLSFYDVEKRSHLYTYNEKFTEELYPVFGTVEVVNDLVIRPADVRQPCLCPGPCLWN